MINLSEFINNHVIFRKESLFTQDIEQQKDSIRKEIEGKKVLVIGGAGSIGSSFIRAILPFKPSRLYIIDLNENGLVEVTRDLRSTYHLYMPQEYHSYTLDFADPILKHIFKQEKGFDIVANFSAHKHVRSEKDRFSVQALLQNNILKAKTLLDILNTYPPAHFFCVSTDKAANPVNIMGASKKIMEDLIFSYQDSFCVNTARFANVAFSNGSLLDGFLNRLQKGQPLAAPTDVKRYFVSPEESGQICMLSCVLGKGGEIFYPKLKTEQMETFSSICSSFLDYLGLKPFLCHSEEEAKAYAAQRNPTDKNYPVFYFESDTTGEKPYEEFFVEGEEIDVSRFLALGVITRHAKKSKAEINEFLGHLTTIFQKEDFNKEDIVEAIQQFLPNFEHIEKGKNLDQKM